MSLPTVFLPEAREEFAEAYHWYNSQKTGLGDELENAVSNSLALIAEQPQLFAPGKREIRRTNLKRFSFTLFFRLEPQRIVVIALHHWKRNPKRWPKR